MHAAVDGFIRFADTSALPAQPQLVDDRPDPAFRKKLLASLPPQTAVPQATQDAAIAEARKALGRSHVRDLVAMQSWFLDRMIGSPAPLQEKMTLFWHGHFTSAYQKGIPAQRLVDQNNLYRTHALGNIRDLTLAVSQDPAMLRYLDNAQNNKAHPNENYARELMELFTLGIGNYTETDVRESARAFTGWGLDRDFNFRDFPQRHDTGRRRSSAARATSPATTSSRSSSPSRGRAMVRQETARLFRLQRSRAAVDRCGGGVDSQERLQPAACDVDRIAQQRVLQRRAYRALVKSPVEFVAGSYQLFGIKQSDIVALGALRRMGQILFVPPNVKGWDGGAAWLNSQTVLTRENFASSLMAKMGGAGWLQRQLTSTDPAAVSRALTATILQGDVSASSTARLTAYLDGTSVSALAALSGENADERVRGAAYLTMAMPAYQLA